MKKTLGFLGGVFVLSALIVFINVKAEGQALKLGSVGIANEYMGTTTSVGYKNNQLVGPSRSDNAAPGSVAPTCTNTLGSIVIAGAGSLSGNLEFYDATTTDITARAPSMSTSSIILATISNTATAATYTFDRVLLNEGLIMSFNPTGTVNTFAAGVASTTITCR